MAETTPDAVAAPSRLSDIPAARRDLHLVLDGTGHPARYSDQAFRALEPHLAALVEAARADERERIAREIEADEWMDPTLLRKRAANIARSKP